MADKRPVSVYGASGLSGRLVGEDPRLMRLRRLRERLWGPGTIVAEYAGTSGPPSGATRGRA